MPHSWNFQKKTGDSQAGKNGKQKAEKETGWRFYSS